MRSLALILATLIYITTAHAQVVIPPVITNAVETDPIWSAASNLYATTAGVAAAYLPLAGGTMDSAAEIDMGNGAITNISYIGYFDVNSSAISFEDEPAQFAGNWTFNTQPTIPGYINTNNLSTIAGSGLGVSSNQIVVSSNDEVSFGTATVHKISAKSYSGGLSGNHTNPSLTITAKDSVYGGFYSIHSGDIIIKPGDGISSAVPFGGDVFISGGAGYTSANNGNVIVSNVSSIYFKDGTAISNFASSLSGFANNILTINLLLGLPESSRTNISAGNAGAIQAGKGWTTNAINITGYSQHGIVENFGPAVGSARIGFNAHGASQNGWIYGGNATIGDYAYGSMQRGYLRNSNAVATLNGAASIQLFYITNEATAFTTTNAYGSILLGPGTNDVAYSIKAAGGFYGNASGLSNFPSSILTVTAGNANYWRITSAPTGATSSGSSGQLAVSGTNIYIYSPNALGVGTARWLRVTGDAAW